MGQKWFEMQEILRQKLNNKIWIPLRSVNYSAKNGKYGYVGYKEDFFVAGSIAVATSEREKAEKLQWADVGISHQHSGYYNDGSYQPCDIYVGECNGLHLVLDQYFNSKDTSEWHLHQDLVITLGLKREGDVWVCPREGYIVVARLKREENDKPCLIEIRSEFLKDYLCARDMALLITSFYERREVVSDVKHINWIDGNKNEELDRGKWEGRIIEIHEGGHPYGEKAFVMHMERTDVNDTDDIPDISDVPTSENTASKSWEKEYQGRKLYNVSGLLWRNEWIEPANISVRIKGDKITAPVFFIVDEQGNKESQESLEHSGKWLWFKPDVMMALAHHRGGSLEWYTKDTGSVGCAPDCDVHFGVNELGLINVFAKDIVSLPQWQQQIWAASNCSPDGGVSKELLASQVHVEPAVTQAPEAFLELEIENVNKIAEEKLGGKLFIQHDIASELYKKTHRFRAVDSSGLYSLAKDIARLTADSLNISLMQKIVTPPKKEKWGSLKTLENLLATKIDPKNARTILSPLVGAYELRHGDAHLPGNALNDAFKLVGIEENIPTIMQGYQLVCSCVSSIAQIRMILLRADDINI